MSQNAEQFSYEVVISNEIAVGTSRTYASCIRSLKNFMTEGEKVEHLGENGLLFKCLPLNTVLRIIHDSQKKFVNGIYVGMKTNPTLPCSALKYWYKTSNRDRAAETPLIVVSDEISRELSAYCSGRSRMDATERANGEEVDGEGKLPLTFDGYCFLANNAIKKSIMFHPYLILSWNLMARSKTIANLLWNNIAWSEDCLTVLYEKGKTNQDGENKVPRHVFANPGNPAICPVLALGLRYF